MRIPFAIQSLALSGLLVSPALAESPAAQSDDANAIIARQSVATPGTLTGEWGGLRSRLRDDGVDLTGGYVSESAWNVSGGQRNEVRETGQFTFGATVATDKLLGVAGGTFQATITYRRGKDLGAAAGLGVLQQVQEVFGRGNTWRVTQFWYQQSFAGDLINLKFGRLTQGEDFAAFTCELQNLSFCGSPPGNLAGDYWYNWPISQWGARLRIKHDSLYAMVGAYEVNRHNLDKDFTVGHFHGASGVLIPFEAGYTPQIGSRGLPGAYRFGGWYNTANADDVALDINRGNRVVTGLAPLRRNGRYGFFAQFRQQFTGTVEETPSGPRTSRGLVGFLNITQTDRKTTATDNQIAAGVFYTGLIRSRPKDEFALAIARTNVNARSLLGFTPGAPRPNAEYATELAYRIQAVSWLSVRPNVQYIVDPGGFELAKDVVVLGIKASLTL
ncbi:carbohydrate porin [Rhizorhabdus argentea]|uniref:carbohydrate porin n=1 Tax=Rhizorhabdus argentea TaxID=1387174 RepID=UPI0030EEA9BE